RMLARRAQRFPERRVHAVRLGRGREIDHRFGERQLPLGRAEKMIGVLRRQGDAQRPRVGEPHVLRRDPHQAPGHIERVLAPRKHPREPVERALHVAAAYCPIASSAFSARRASPCAYATSASIASGASATGPASPFPFPSSGMLRSMRVRMWVSESGSNTNTRQRESSGAVSSNEGFSVVAPISVITPFSTQGRKASCWARLKRWISSQKRIVPRPSYLSRSSAARMISRTRPTPSVTAENGSKCRSV